LTGFLTVDISSGREPIYYSYAADRLVYRADDPIIINGAGVGPVREYYPRTLTLVKLYDKFVVEDGAVAEDWKPLGIYAVADISEDVNRADPDRYVELVISKKGALGGTYHDVAGGKDYAITGAVDPETQRAAFMVNDTQETFETGLYNLTQPEAPALQISPDLAKQVVLIRIQDPQQPIDTSY
jgi:hypothetical protein